MKAAGAEVELLNYERLNIMSFHKQPKSDTDNTNRVK